LSHGDTGRERVSEVVANSDERAANDGVDERMDERVSERMRERMRRMLEG
jgi:hypothetical protein